MSAFESKAQQTNFEPSPEVEDIIEEAKAGAPHAQYFLGLIYQEGKLVPKNLTTAYIWLNMAGKQDFKDAKQKSEQLHAYLSSDQRGVARVLSEQYYKQYVLPYIPHFTVNINGTKITNSTSVSPEIPMTMIFTHVDPRVTKVRMQDPNNKANFEDFEIGRPYEISKHDKYMAAGRTSASVFVALDDANKVYDHIKLTFEPVNEQQDENSQ